MFSFSPCFLGHPVQRNFVLRFLINFWPVENLKHIHWIISISESGVQMSGSLEQSKINSSIWFLTKISFPSAPRLHPVFCTQCCSKQRDTETTHEKSDKYKRTFFKVHYYSFCFLVYIVSRPYPWNSQTLHTPSTYLGKYRNST